MDCPSPRDSGSAMVRATKSAAGGETYHELDRPVGIRLRERRIGPHERSGGKKQKK
jgi:hypothetical protein